MRKLGDFKSVFAPYLRDFLVDWMARGFCEKTVKQPLYHFDEYCIEQNLAQSVMDRQIAIGWIDAEIARGCANGAPNQMSALRNFARYMLSIGKEAFVIPTGYLTVKRSFTPYILSDEELATLFQTIDRLPPCASKDPAALKVAPILFRMVYTCGLRPQEAWALKIKDINFITGEVFIARSKQNKERIIVMSDDMLELCKTYKKQRALRASDSAYFFARSDGSAFDRNFTDYLFMRCWQRANPGVPVTKLPRLRIYDLRHRFASAILHKWLDEGRDLYAMLPYLRSYMGHENIAQTAYYIHILPEHLLKSPGVSWEALDRIVPEVPAWKE